MSRPRTVEALLTERSALIARVAAIDAALVAKGVRPVQRVVGRGREKAGDVLAFISRGICGAGEIAKGTGQTPHAVQQMLYLLAKAGEIHRVKQGVYKVGAA